MIPARSPGANPVRQAMANWALVSHSTLLTPMPPRSWVSTSPISPYSTWARPCTPPPACLAVLAMRASLATIVTNASVRTETRESSCASSSLMVATAGWPPGCRWRVIHWSRSAPSSGTVRTNNRISSSSSVRLA